MQQLGAYVLEEELGRGGMGVVWRARDAALDRVVAIKVLLRALATPSELERFRREALAQARLRHPAIACLLTCGSTPTGQPFLVLDLVDGVSLATTLRERGPLPVADGVRVVATLARAIHYAHSRGVLHRDLKSSNVLLEAATGEPVLIDFGLACLTGVERLTQTGQMLGTPGCMAPEQAMGMLSQIGPRTDVYGLGVVLHEALTGRAPFEGAEFFRLLTDVVDVAPPPLARSRPGLDPRLEAIARRCLEKDPDRRWPTALALAEALEAVAAERRPPPRLAFGVAAVVGAVGWCGLVGLALAPGAPAPGVAASGPAAITSDDLLRSSRLLAEAGVAAERRDGLREAQELLDRAVALSPTVEALSGRARVASRLGEGELARRDLLALAGGEPEGVVLAAYGLALTDDDAAQEVAERAVAATAARDARALAARAFAHAVRGGQGAEDADAALALDPAEPLALLARSLASPAAEGPRLLEQATAGFEARGDALGVAAALSARARALLKAGPGADRAAAQAALDAALARAPALRRALLQRGLVGLALAADEEPLDRDGVLRVIADAERLCALTGQEPRVVELLAYAHLRLALDPARGFDAMEADRAQAALTRGLDRRPESVTLLVARAELKATTGDAVGAEADARAALAKASAADDDDRATAVLARLRARRGEVTEGLAVLAPLLGRAGSRAPRALAERSLLLAALRQAAQARADAEQAVALEPTLARGHLALCRALVLGGAPADLARALAAAEEAARLQPGLAQARSDVAALRAKLHKADRRETVAALERAAALEPWAPEHPLNLSVILEAAGVADEADAALERALALDPGWPLARLHRGGRRLTGDPRGALADLLVVTERQPWHADAWLCQAMARCSLRDLEGALQDVTRALDLAAALRPGSEGAAYALRAALRCDLGDGVRALPDAEEALRLDPTSPDALRGRARARALVGDLPGALADLDAALAQQPTQARWRLERAELLLRGDAAARERAQAELEALVRGLAADDPLARRARALLGPR